MDWVNQVQILHEAVCISRSTNTVGKVRNQTILAMGEL